MNPVTNVDATLPLGTGVASQNPATDDPEFEADLGLRGKIAMYSVCACVHVHDVVCNNYTNDIIKNFPIILQAIPP